MAKIADLQQDKTAKKQAALEILEIANNENRMLTEDETGKRNALATEIETLSNRIEQMEEAKREKIEVAATNKAKSDKIPGLRKGRRKREK